MLNLALSSIPKRRKNAPLICPGLKVPALIGDHSLSSEEPKAKSLFVDILHDE